MKTCTKCGKRKPLAAFNRLYKGGTYRRTTCQDCTSANNRERMSQQGASREKFKYALAWWGLTVEQFAWMLYRANFQCENPGCCKPIDLDKPGVWGIDHGHGHCTGTRGCTKCIRGILCSGCNTALGFLGDSGDKIVGLLEYLGLVPSQEGTKHHGAGGKSGVEPAGKRTPKTVVH